MMLLLAISNILTNGFDQYFMFYNPLVMLKSDFNIPSVIEYG